jgi:hypothetical protein
MIKTTIAVILFFPLFCQATRWQVGPSRTYTSPSQVASLVNTGDTVEIDAVAYNGDVCAWTKDNLFLTGVGGRPHLIANGNNALGKGIWVFIGNNITVENIEFSGATVPDENGAGIRLDGMGINVKNCYFHNNENGILTANNGGTIRIDNSEFGYNGFGDGFTHNIYIGRVDSAIIRFCYFHHAAVGHELKSRARVNYILYNRLSNEATGNASREIDLPNGGVSIILGNIIQQGPNSENGNIIGYGLEGLANTAPHEIYVVNNTIVNERGAGSFVSVHDNASFIKVYNNIFAGPGSPLVYGGAAIPDSSSNKISTSITEFGFVNPSAYDYHVANTSVAVNGGAHPGSTGSGTSLLAQFEYQHPTGSTPKNILGSIDIGSYESSIVLPADISAFSVLRQQEKIVVRWKAANETNLAFYDIMKSEDGSHFQKLGSITPIQNRNEYEWEDKVKLGTFFYQLKVVDRDGSIRYSKIIHITVSETISSIITARLEGNTLYINRIPGDFYLKDGTIQLYNAVGSLLFTQKIRFPGAGVVAVPKIPHGYLSAQLFLVIQNAKNRITIPLQH